MSSVCKATKQGGVIISNADVVDETILADNFQDYEIEKAEISETSSGKFYDFEIEQGEEEFEVIFDAQGNIIKKKKSEEEDNGED